MFIPLSLFFLAWLALLAVFALLALVSVVQMLRFGIAGPGTYLSTALFLLVVAGVVGGTFLYLSGVDWTLGLTLGDVIPL
jgi:hypothetical protein